MTPSPTSADTIWSPRRFLVLGYGTLIVTVVGLGAWGVSTRIAGAVIAPGIVAVEGNRQVVQHLEGGVIEAINVGNGDVVKAGDVLIELDGDQLRSELQIVEGQWFEILARQSRLAAERDLADHIEFSPELLAHLDANPKIADLMTAQQQQFDARRKVQGEEEAQLREQEAQIAKQIDGLVALQAANRSQIELLTREIDGQEALLSQGLTELTRVLTPRRELARLQGNLGQVESAIAENRGKIAETAIERVRLASKTRETAIGELRDLDYREIELRERRLALQEQVKRLALRAPSSGVVYGNTADTVRGVIRPAEPILYIVPQDAHLIVKARVETTNVDKVHVGQEATLRFSAFDMRTTPEVEGNVMDVSADAIEDPQTRMHYYEADIAITDAARAELGDAVQLLPGMPVEAFIKTDYRSPLDYLVKPLADYFAKAFREG